MEKSKKYIAIIIPGGIGTGANNMGIPVLEQLVKLLSKEYSITVFSLFKVNSDYQAKGFKLISIPSRNSVVKSIQLFLTFRKHHKKNKFTVIHGFWALPSGLLAVVLGKLFGIKNIVSVLGGDAANLPEIGYGELRHWLSRKLIFWTLENSDEVTLLTKFLLKNYVQYKLRHEMKIIPWGIDTTLFSFREKPLSNPVQFLHIANLSPVKDQSTLLKAFKIISDQRPSHLTIIGTGSLTLQVKQLAIQLEQQSKVTFVQPVHYAALPAYFHRADIMLHTSLSEGQSEVVTEAMSAGVIVCGTKVGLLYDLPECCVSVSVKDFMGLADQVLKLLNDPNQLFDIRKNAYAWSQAHSIQWTIEEIKKLYF